MIFIFLNRLKLIKQKYNYLFQIKRVFDKISEDENKAIILR